MKSNLSEAERSFRQHVNERTFKAQDEVLTKVIQQLFGPRDFYQRGSKR